MYPGRRRRLPTLRRRGSRRDETITSFSQACRLCHGTVDATISRGSQRLSVAFGALLNERACQILDAQAALDHIQKAIDRIEFLEGDEEDRLDEIMEQLVYFDGLLSIYISRLERGIGST